MTATPAYDPSFAAVFGALVAASGLRVADLARRAGAPARYAIDNWLSGKTEPYAKKSFDFLAGLERDWSLPEGYFRTLLSKRTQGRAVRPHAAVSLPELGGGVVRWHIPDDFRLRPQAEQAEICAWIERTLGADKPRGRPNISGVRSAFPKFALLRHIDYASVPGGDRSEFARRQRGRPRSTSVTLEASPTLVEEWLDLVTFKTSIFARVGLSRNQTWGAHSVERAAAVLGGLLGRICHGGPSPAGKSFEPLAVDQASLAYLVFPEVWDLVITERIAEQGGVSTVEKSLLIVAISMLAPTTGWLRQKRDLGAKIGPIPGLVSDRTAEDAKTDWSEACDRCHLYAQTRMKDLDRIRRHSRDHFHGIGVLLDAAAPMVEYRKIADEVLRRLPDRQAYPMAWAEAFRAFVMIRLAMHTGLRQRNLRELLFCPNDQPIRSLYELARLRCGELRWRSDLRTWEVLIPPEGFKNGHSPFFAQGPYRMQLPDHGDLYEHIQTYIEFARPLIVGADGPACETFLVKRPFDGSAEVNKESFYRIWRQTIAKHGVYNRWTGRGAIVGLRPHGPHALRAVLATHLLKMTRSYEIAGYAIQDLPETVESAYGRFLPSDKSAMVTDLLAGVWQEAPIAAIGRR